MTILEEIINHKRKEIAERASTHPTKLLEQSLYPPQPQEKGASHCGANWNFLPLSPLE